MSKIVNIHEAKTHLSRLIREVLAGDEVIIARADVPLVKLVLLDQERPGRVLGSAKGLVKMRADFEEPLQDFGEYV